MIQLAAAQPSVQQRSCLFPHALSPHLFPRLLPTQDNFHETPTEALPTQIPPYLEVRGGCCFFLLLLLIFPFCCFFPRFLISCSLPGRARWLSAVPPSLVAAGGGPKTSSHAAACRSPSQPASHDLLHWAEFSSHSVAR